MATSGTFTLHLDFPSNASRDFMRYTYALIEECGGVPTDMHFSENADSSFSATFTSLGSQVNFINFYEEALQGRYITTTWNKVNDSLKTFDFLAFLKKLMHPNEVAD